MSALISSWLGSYIFYFHKNLQKTSSVFCGTFIEHY
jgi:hypothetical protein